MKKIHRRALLGGATFAIAGVGAYGIYLNFIAPGVGAEMTPPEMLDAVRKGSVLLVDVRRPDEWQATGIPEGAVPIDLRRDDFVEAVIAAQVSPDQPVGVICARGVRSRRMTRLLDEAGVVQIVDVPEGMLGSSAGPGWLERGLPVEAWSS